MRAVLFSTKFCIDQKRKTLEVWCLAEWVVSGTKSECAFYVQSLSFFMPCLLQPFTQFPHTLPWLQLRYGKG